MARIKIFLSFSSTYQDVAKGLKEALLTLATDAVSLDIQFSVDMAGAADWRAWIEDQVRSADIFLLVYPHAAMAMDWSNFELGRFIDRDLPVVCLKNVDIDKPPPAFAPFQAYIADVDGITKFLHELFVTGALTKGVPLNPQIARPASEHFKRARLVAEEIAALFAQARMREHFYERRATLSTVFDADGRLDPDQSTLHGNSEGLSVLGLNAAKPTSWRTLKQLCGESAAWLLEIEGAIPHVPSGVLPPALSPFRAAGGTYIPVIVKAEVTDDRLSTLVLIFVAASDERLRPLFGWTFPPLMPAGLRGLLTMVRLMFRSRWEVLAPRHQQMRFGPPETRDAKATALQVIADYEHMTRRVHEEGGGGSDQFFELFRGELHDEVRHCGDEWMALIESLRTADSPQAVTEVLESLLANNRRWLDLASRQFQHAVNELR